jgi:hypothetical protein
VKFQLKFVPKARATLATLENENLKKYKKVLKTLALLQINPRHPGLKTHKYQSLNGPNGEEIFEAYVENKTPAAFRVFWFYGPGKAIITIQAITPHP